MKILNLVEKSDETERVSERSFYSLFKLPTHTHSYLHAEQREFSHEENLFPDFQSVNVLPQDLMQNDDDVGGREK
jgi:hypothetical protein